MSLFFLIQIFQCSFLSFENVNFNLSKDLQHDLHVLSKQARERVKKVQVYGKEGIHSPSGR